MKNYVINRMMGNGSMLNQAHSADISELDIDVRNKSMVLASSKPTPLKIASKDQFS